MLAIRMQRNGRTHYPVYRIVVQEAQRHPLSGRVVAEVGNYNPHTKKITINQEKVEFYLKNGAQPSSRVASILQKQGVKLPKWYKAPTPKHSSIKHADKLRKNQPKLEESEAADTAEPTPTTTSDTDTATIQAEA